MFAMYKIMIVEDDNALAAATQKHIEAWGFEAYCIRNFLDILLEFVTYKPHLIILDIVLPFFNGYHWCTEILALPRRASYLFSFPWKMYLKLYF